MTHPKLADASVGVNNLIDSSVTNPKIGVAAVTSANIAAATIVSANIANATITSAQIASATIQGANIANATIATANIANAAITNALIANSAVGSSQIIDASILTAKIADAAIVDAKIHDLTAEKITAGLLSVSRLNITGIILEAFIWSDHAPVSANTAWSTGIITYKGVQHSIANGNTAQKYIYWQLSLPTVFQTSNTSPILGDDDFLIATNVAGVHDLAWNNSQAAQSIDTGQLADTSITTAKIQNAAITSALIADATIGSAKIISASILNVHIANAAIDNSKIADATITSAKIASLDAGKITTGTLIIGGSTAPVISVLDGSGASVGWLGTVDYVGGWIKRFGIGGTSASTAQLQVDTAGNVSLSGGAVINMQGIVDSSDPTSSTSGYFSSKNCYVSVIKTGISGFSASSSLSTSGTVAGSFTPAGGTERTFNVSARNSALTINDGSGNTATYGVTSLTIGSSSVSQTTVTAQNGVFTSLSAGGSNVVTYAVLPGEFDNYVSAHHLATQSYVANALTGYALIVTTDSLASRISSLESASSSYATVSTTNGLSSEINTLNSQTASISNRVSSIEGNYATQQQVIDYVTYNAVRAGTSFTINGSSFDCAGVACSGSVTIYL